MQQSDDITKSSGKPTPKLTPVFRQVAFLDSYGNQVMQDESGTFYFQMLNGGYQQQDQ